MKIKGREVAIRGRKARGSADSGRLGELKATLEITPR
jgi:hypothetical protein